MFEERAEECGATRHLGELRGDAIGQLFALLQGPACLPGALRVAPYQLIGVEVRGIAGQVMQGQLAVESRNVFLDRERLVGGQPIKDQMQRGTTPTQHPAQQVHEQRAGQGAPIGGEPEGGAFGPVARQALARQQRPNRGQAQPHAESLGDQFALNLARRQPEVDPVLPRILPIDPAKHLSFFPRRQGPWRPVAGRAASAPWPRPRAAVS